MCIGSKPLNETIKTLSWCEQPCIFYLHDERQMAFFTESTNESILAKSRTNDTNSFVGWLPISMSWVLLTLLVMPITITLQPRIIAGSASNFCFCHLFLAAILSFLFEHVSLLLISYFYPRQLCWAGFIAMLIRVCVCVSVNKTSQKRFNQSTLFMAGIFSLIQRWND